MWEKGIELTKELVHLYEEELYDYERLSVILVCGSVYHVLFTQHLSWKWGPF